MYIVRNRHDELLESMTRYFCGFLDVAREKKNVTTINQIEVDVEEKQEGQAESGEW